MPGAGRRIAADSISVRVPVQNPLVSHLKFSEYRHGTVGLNPYFSGQIGVLPGGNDDAAIAADVKGCIEPFVKPADFNAELDARFQVYIQGFPVDLGGFSPEIHVHEVLKIQLGIQAAQPGNAVGHPGKADGGLETTEPVSGSKPNGRIVGFAELPVTGMTVKGEVGEGDPNAPCTAVAQGVVVIRHAGGMTHEKRLKLQIFAAHKPGGTQFKISAEGLACKGIRLTKTVATGVDHAEFALRPEVLSDTGDGEVLRKAFIGFTSAYLVQPDSRVAGPANNARAQGDGGWGCLLQDQFCD